LSPANTFSKSAINFLQRKHRLNSNQPVTLAQMTKATALAWRSNKADQETPARMTKP
jgi:hypothetical protein